MVSDAPTARGRDPSGKCPQVLGVPFYMHTSCDGELSNLTYVVLTHMGRGLVLSGQPRPTSRGRVPELALCNFGVPLIYSCVHPLSQNYQISQDNTYGEGFVFRVLFVRKVIVRRTRSSGCSTSAQNRRFSAIPRNSVTRTCPQTPGKYHPACF